jgi:hypothetical protein
LSPRIGNDVGLPRTAGTAGAANALPIIDAAKRRVECIAMELTCKRKTEFCNNGGNEVLSDYGEMGKIV